MPWHRTVPGFKLLLALLAGLLLAVPGSAWAGKDDEDDEDDDEEEEQEGGDESKEGGNPDLPPWAGEEGAEEDKSTAKSKSKSKSDDDDEDGDDDDDDDDEDEEEKPKKEKKPKPKTKSIGKLKGGGPFGIGFGVGSWNGISAKIWPSRTHGFTIGIGNPRILNALAVALSYRAHGPPLSVPKSPVSLLANAGPALRSRMVFYRTGTYIELAGGLAVGLSIVVSKVPAELFFEVAPMFGGGISPAGVGIGFDVDGLVGARFYLGG